MELKNGMKVIAPDGCETWLTAGKEYEVFDVEESDTIRKFYFGIIGDYNIKCNCFLVNCAHINGKDWIIKQEEKPISLNLDLLIEVAEAVNNIYFKTRLTHLKNDLQQLAKDNPNDSELGAKFRKLINQ